MELIDSLSRLAARVPDQLPVLKTEEATKNALVMPLINALGYNVFDPLEVIPEFTADVGTKKGEKVDYVIMIAGKPMILIECKMIGSALSLNNASQLYRYFSVTEARFAVLTNGIDYWFYTDLDAPNRMDDKPFYEFSLLDLTGRAVDELQKFSRGAFDLSNILSNATELKYVKQIKKAITDEYANPSEEFVRLFTSRVHSGPFRAGIKEQFTQLVRQSFHEFARDQLNARLKQAIDGNIAIPAKFDVGAEGKKTEADDDADDADLIMTTAEELEAFHIVRAILARDVDPRRVVMRDTKSYCGILLDDNNRKPICRLRFNFSQKYLTLLDEARAETRIPISDVHEIYAHADQLLTSLRRLDATRTARPTRDGASIDYSSGETPVASV